MTPERQTELRTRHRQIYDLLEAMRESGLLKTYEELPEEAQRLTDESNGIEHELALAGDPDFPHGRIELAVNAVDGRTRQPFEKRLVLNSRALSVKQMIEIRGVLRGRKPMRDAQILKFRNLFRQETAEDVELERVRNGRGYSLNTTLEGYHEDENDVPLSLLGYMQKIAGQDEIIVRGNVESVLRIGPTDLKLPEQWNQKNSNDVAHFLEVVTCLSKSDWVSFSTGYSVEMKWKDGKQSNQIVQFKRPDVLMMNSVLVFIRQLFGDADVLFALATNAYLKHTSNEGKQFWVTEERKLFNKALKSPCAGFDLDGRTGREVIDLFLYAFGLIHHAKPEQAHDFKGLIAKHGREQVMMAVQQTLHLVLAHALNVAHVIAQDFSHWVRSGQCVKPDRVGITDLLGPIKEN